MDGMLKKDIYLVADGGLGLADGAFGEFKHRCSPNPHGGHAPGLELLFDVDDNPLPVEVNGVDGKTHGEGVNAVGRVDPQALAAGEAGRVGGHKSAKAGPVGARDREIGGEVGGAGAIKSVSLGPGHGDIESLSD